jgi:hypothetical protein
MRRHLWSHHKHHHQRLPEFSCGVRLLWRHFMERKEIRGRAADFLLTFGRRQFFKP